MKINVSYRTFMMSVVEIKGSLENEFIHSN